MKKYLLISAMAFSCLSHSSLLAETTVYEEETVPYVVVEKEPPKVIEETITTKPGPNYVWATGHWRWEGKWIWVKGHWVTKPHPEAEWISGHWNKKANYWVWIHGHWE